jgi:hypothetical protein
MDFCSVEMQLTAKEGPDAGPIGVAMNEELAILHS